MVPDVGTYMQQSQIHLLWNTNYTQHHLQWISDSTGPASAVDITRNYLSSYMWSHYGDLDPTPPKQSSNLLSLLQQTKPYLPSNESLIDVGCSVGRGTFWLAAQTDQPVLGVDLNYSMLLHAHEVLLRDRVVYGQRMNGCIYEWKDYPAFFEHRERIDFWVADATCLPFVDQQCAAAVSLNVMDCTNSPMLQLAELIRIAREFHHFCPYDWSTNVTEYNQWIGGHGFFSDWKGDPVELLRYLLSPESPDPVLKLGRILREKDHLPWRVRSHERAIMHYDLHYIHGCTTHQED